MNRTETRRIGFEFMYSLEIQKSKVEEYEEQLNLFLQENEIQNDKVSIYINDLMYGMNEHIKEITQIIQKELSEKWELNRLSKISLTILKISTYEMAYKKLPHKVVVNEAVELAKQYGDDNAPSFINGILANIVKNNNFYVD